MKPRRVLALYYRRKCRAPSWSAFRWIPQARESMRLVDAVLEAVELSL